MITEISFQFDNLPSPILKKILRNDFLQADAHLLSDEAIIHICDILLERNAQKNPPEVIDTEKKWQTFFTSYLDSDNDDDP